MNNINNNINNIILTDNKNTINKNTINKNTNNKMNIKESNEQKEQICTIISGKLNYII
jgi:hypothetical protein